MVNMKTIKRLAISNNPIQDFVGIHVDSMHVDTSWSVAQGLVRPFRGLLRPYKTMSSTTVAFFFQVRGALGSEAMQTEGEQQQELQELLEKTAHALIEQAIAVHQRAVNDGPMPNQRKLQEALILNFLTKIGQAQASS